MASATVRVVAAAGLHARPAAMLVQVAARQSGGVRIGRPGQEPADAKSILAVLSLAVSCGEEVVVETDGPAAEVALREMLEVLRVDPDTPSEHTRAGASVL